MPAPKNDYEIVLPEDNDTKEASVDESIDIDRSDYIGEQYEILDESDVQVQKRLLLKQKRKKYLK